MTRIPAVLKPLLTVVTAAVDEHGNLIDANDGFFHLVESPEHSGNGAPVAQFFIQPNFLTLVNARADGDGVVYTGLMTLGIYSGRTCSLRGTVIRKETVLHLLAEYDIADLEHLANTVLELNRDYASSQIELAQANFRMQQLIAELEYREEQERKLAFYDALTNLPNRRLLNDRLSQAVAASKRNSHYYALMFIDLDNFKSLNDTHGHEIGDLLLIEVANRLKGCVREIDTVARFGGDEFVVMLNDLDADKAESTSEAGIVAEKIRLALALPYRLTARLANETTTIIEHQCTASIGVTLFIDHEASQDEILRWADATMYKAKLEGRNMICFHEA